MKKSENKIKKTILLTIESKGIKYFGINLTKEVQNYKTLLKEIKEDKNKWKDIPCSWTGKLNIFKMESIVNIL